MKNKVEMGYAVKAHGIKGAFSFMMHNRDSRLIEKGTSVLLIPQKSQSSLPESGQEFEVSLVNYGNKPFIELLGVTDRNSIEEMLPFNVLIDRSLLPDLEDGEYYISDLEGMSVVNEKGKEVGHVSGHYDNGSQYIITVRCKNGSTIELPFVEQFFPEVDLEKKTIVMITPQHI
jgi:16S rRNA processing protein RimM